MQARFPKRAANGSRSVEETLVGDAALKSCERQGKSQGEEGWQRRWDGREEWTREGRTAEERRVRVRETDGIAEHWTDVHATRRKRLAGAYTTRQDSLEEPFSAQVLSKDPDLKIDVQVWDEALDELATKVEGNPIFLLFESR